MEQAIRDAMRIQRDFCLKMGAPITARVCDALAIALDGGTEVGAKILAWPGDAIADALPLRIVGGLHALALAGGDDDATAAFAPSTSADDTVIAIRRLLHRHDRALLPWLDGPPQTNEVGRAAPLMLGLMAVTRAFAQPLALLEIGASAGLNLLIGHFAFDLGGIRLGPRDARVTLAPAWRGRPPAPIDVRIASARGVDVSPIDAGDPAQVRRLRAFVWADNPDRQARLSAALALAGRHPPQLARGDGADWLDRRLAEPQPGGITRVLMHSVVWQYLEPDRRARIRRAMERAGAAATPDRPLAWVRMEPDRDLARHDVWVRTWPGDGERRIATTHAHGSWIESLS